MMARPLLLSALVMATAHGFHASPAARGLIRAHTSNLRSRGARGRAALLDPTVFDQSSLLLANTSADYTFGGSYASLYATLVLFAISFPGIISLVTRSTKVVPVQKSYMLPGPSATTDAKPLRQAAAEIMAYFQANNYKVESAGETIVFKGLVLKSKSQAFFLSFCLFGGLGCLALVLSIQLPVIGPLEIGSWYYAMCLVSPLAGLYYWNNAPPGEEVRVRLVESDAGDETEVKMQASKEVLELFAMTMNYTEKGKVPLATPPISIALQSLWNYRLMRDVGCAHTGANSRYFRDGARS
jgi:hypothetical protein